MATQAVAQRLDVGRVAISAVIVLAIAAAVYMLDTGRDTDATPVSSVSEGPGPKVGLVAPDFESTTTEGERVRLSDLKGRPVWINFWASWCPPCRAETPDMIAAFDAHRSTGLALLAVSYGESAEAARSYVRTSGLNGTIVLDPTGAIASRYHINGIPTHVFIQSDGTVKRIFVGSINRDLADRYLGEIIAK